MSEQMRRSLDADELAAVLDAAARDDWQQAVLLTYRAFGVDLADENCPRISPSDYALPTEQWNVICSAIIEGATDSGTGIGKANRGMDWVNIGPSAYGDDE